MNIPKVGQPGKFRPLGIRTFEDEVFQRAVVMGLEAVYGPDFKAIAGQLWNEPMKSHRDPEDQEPTVVPGAGTAPQRRRAR